MQSPGWLTAEDFHRGGAERAGIIPKMPNTLVGVPRQEWDSPDAAREVVCKFKPLEGLTVHDIYLLLRTIRNLRAEAWQQPEVDVRLKKLEREIEAELLESQESHEWANC